MSNDIRVAAPALQRVRPAFMVQKLEGQVEREVFNFDAKGKKVKSVIKVDAGYLVTTARGNSFRVYTDAEMQRLGFDRNIPLVDFEREGEIVGTIPNPVAA